MSCFVSTSLMKPLIASLHQLIASAASRAQGVVHRLAASTAATTRWQHIPEFAAALARKSAAVATNLLFAVRMLRRPPTQQQEGPTRPINRGPIFPIRVIDVEETVGSRHGNVVFIKPTSWEFHTISHTWSKGVQSWSNIVATKMQDQQSTSIEVGEAVRYNDLFGREDFSWHECYYSFMEFLRLLRADGVKKVWLDALCINQGSEIGEKSQELQNMGSYYANSFGCYVCAHGFGEGFETWKEQEGPDQLVMPRWFNRVWTFQELLLPKNVTFILDIHPVIRRTINWTIRKQAESGVRGPCKCALSTRPFPQPRYLHSDDDEGEEEEDGTCSSDHDGHKDVILQKKRGNKEIICGEFPCSQCGESGLIRRVKDRRLLQQLQASPATADLFFIDRQCIVRLMIMAKEQLERTVWKKCDENAEWKLLRLETVMQQREYTEEEKEEKYSLQQGDGRVDVLHGYWDPIQVVVEISKRDCTQDEDRVLSILGLLGVEGAVQLRAGKTLDEQLLQLAQQLTRVNPTILVQLCVAQFAGHPTPGMSWAPFLARGREGAGLRPTGEEAATPTWKELHRDKHVEARQIQVEEAIEPGLLQLGRVMRHFVRNVEIKDVLDNGSLLLSEARVLWDCCFVRVDKNIFDLQLNHNVKKFPFQAYFSPSSCLLHHNVFVAGHTTLANQSIVRLEGTQLDARLHHFQVCLVLLGELDLPVDEKAHQVMMICVGNKSNSLHKVGISWLPGLQEVFSKSDPPSMCNISGFPDYMDRFVFNWDNPQ